MSELDDLRLQIDGLDKEIIEKISTRLAIVAKVKSYKQQNNIAVFDSKREDYLRQYHAKLSQKYGVSIEFITELFELVVTESKRLQKT